MPDGLDLWKGIKPMTIWSHSPHSLERDARESDLITEEWNQMIEKQTSLPHSHTTSKYYRL